MNAIERVRTQMAAHGVPSLLLTDITTVQWLTGFTGSSAAVVLTQTGGEFVTDSRYTIQAHEQVKDLPVRTFGSPKKQSDALIESFQSLGIGTIAFERSVTFATWEDWKEAFSGVELVPSPEIVKPLRMVKSPEEVAKIRSACELTDACLKHVERMLQPGVTEYDIGLDIEFFFRRNGAEVGFSPIVASGPNSARPHATPSERPLQRGDFVTIDLGAKLDGYCSDITRTYVVGRADDRQREVYGQVLKALTESTQALVPGASGVAVDARAREVLDEKGLAQYFGHGLGHGLGRAVHDLGSLSTRSTDTIEAGQVWTVEPGVYIEGFGGVRIEDDVHVTPHGPEILNATSKELTEIQ
jgi:Xaa-Pro aminopeptidase